MNKFARSAVGYIHDSTPTARMHMPGTSAVTIAMALACGLIAGCSKPNTPAESTDAKPAATQLLPMTAIKIPTVKSSPGDNLNPLPEDAPYPSDDPRDLEGIWVGIGMAASIDGQPPPLTEKARANRARMMEAETQGKPITRKGTLCRPPAVINFVNQFPMLIVQRPEAIVIMTEELRGIWHVHMNKPFPAQIEPSYGGYNIGHWEGNTLVIESKGFSSATNREQSSGVKVTTRITRANGGDKRNGDRLIVERTTENPDLYTRPYTDVNLARWRPDLDMLEFNCEEATLAQAADGLVVE